MRKVSINEVKNLKRSLSRPFHVSLDDDNYSLDLPSENMSFPSEKAELVWEKSLKKLSYIDQQIIRLVRKGYNNTQIATELRQDEGWIRRRKSYAFKKQEALIDQILLSERSK